MNIEFYKPGCKDFFKKYARQEAVIKEKIKAAIIKENNMRMTKVKLACKERINGQPIYEFRLNVGKIGSIRIAFTVFDNQVAVYFITTKLQKSVFSQEFSKIVNSIPKN
ncbi:hypothetical protein [Limosilactobacillus caviae]|uniref:Addiction module toxin RelE n=1 Tax=Limosilactobacillus caviae TaxID=1769424 RepID=A0ABQ2C6G8_9LACO|nr:hypothetical protein [Limosilactobacillus caviae]GGI63542.1 hypothetical protein GCM10011459_13760 [Limosilactobacillus caviae]